MEPVLWSRLGARVQGALGPIPVLTCKMTFRATLRPSLLCSISSPEHLGNGRVAVVVACSGVCAPQREHEKVGPSPPAPTPGTLSASGSCPLPFLRRVPLGPGTTGALTSLGLEGTCSLPKTRLGSGGQWRVDEALVLVSHDLTGVDGPHVAEPPGLTFGRWLGKRGSHEALLPTQCPGHPATPTPGTALWAHTLCLHLPPLSPPLPSAVGGCVCMCACVLARRHPEGEG